MKIHIIAIGNKMPAWVNQAYQEYAKRLTGNTTLQLIEIPAETRGKNADLARIKEKEGQKLLEAIPKNTRIIALEVKGKPWTTENLASELKSWQHEGCDISLLIGGPEGMSKACQQAAQIHWSLSPLTLPHPLVRVILAEQIYRAQSILSNHPYHR